MLDGNAGAYQATIGGHIFNAPLDGHGGFVEPFVGSTCTSMTLTAGIEDSDYNPNGTLTLQVEVGKGSDGYMLARRGKLVTRTFNLQPGDFQLAFSGSAGIYVNGHLTCTTASGRLGN
jgi:hypothetical protein